MQHLANQAIGVYNAESTLDEMEVDNATTEQFGKSTYDGDKIGKLKVVHFICNDVNMENVGKVLQLMKESIFNYFEKKQTRGSITNLQKFKTLNQRWFKATNETIEKLPEHNLLERDYINQYNGTYYGIITIFKKCMGNGGINKKGKKKLLCAYMCRNLRLSLLHSCPQQNISVSNFLTWEIILVHI